MKNLFRISGVILVVLSIFLIHSCKKDKPTTVPGAPTGVTASAGDAQATVIFTAPVSNGGSAITGYTVTSNPGGKTGTGTASPITVTGLTNGTAYTFTVKATNTIGNSVASSPSNSVTPTAPLTVPGAPTGVTASAGNAQVTITFTAPVSNGGSAITGYTVTSSPGGVTAAGSTAPITVTGLTNGTAYTFTVTATNAIGNSVASAASNSVTPVTAPGAPTIGTASAGNAQASVIFTATVSDGGSVITSYTVTSNPGGKTGTGTTSPIIVTGLTNGTAYTFTVTATNAIGNSVASSASNSVTPTAPTTIPGTPTGVTASAGNAQATVIFTAPVSNGGSAITGYTITSSPGGVTAAGTASPITVTGLINGTAYTFTVTATNAIGNSVASSPSNSVTPVTVPGAPTIGTASAGNAQASVIFTAPISNGGSVITGYTVTSSPGNITGTGSGSPITVTGLTNGTAYTFTVKATNAIGNSVASAASNSVTPAAPLTVPGAPTIGTASAGNAQATITFTAPVSNGGSVITGYTVTSNPGGKTGTGTTSPIIVTGLTNGTAYTFTVKATNAIGTSVASSPSNSVTPTAPLTVPGAPTIGTASAGNAQATITFSEPISNGGSVITSYTVTSNPGNITGTGTASPITVSGLTNGTAYAFTVKATNAIGTSVASAASNSVTPSTVPGAPTIGTASAGNAQATVIFTAPVSNGGSAITGYTVTSSPGNITGTGSESPITVTGLTNGTAYTFTVKATNAIGNSAASAASNAVTPSTVPGAPTIGTASAGNAQATITFTAPVSNGGSVITGYTVTSNPGGKTGTGTATPITVTGLTNGTAYTFTVTATNAIGNSVASSPSNSVTPTAPLTVPGAPTIGTTSAGNAQASVIFTAPVSNGGSVITGYTVTSSPGNITGTGSGSPITVIGLTNGTAYAFTVKATNAIGNSVASSASNAVTPSTVPGAPTGVTASAGNAQATVIFTAPVSNGGSAITGYTVTSSPGNITGTGSGSPITVTGLTNGTAYTFTVTATNAIGNSVASSASNSVTPVAPSTAPGAPTIGTASAGNAQATITFTAPVSNGGSVITGYTVTSNPGGKTGTGTATPITVTGLTNGTAYTFTVTATNGIGSGLASSASNSVTPLTAPGTPTIGTATAGNAQATVIFTAPVSNGGSTITGYTVTSNPGNIIGTGTASPITVTGLTNGTAYAFTVKATNAIGNSAASAASNAVTPSTVPGAPTIGTASAGNAQATIIFTAPVSNGGSAITSYTVTSNPGSITGTGTVSPITVTGLTNGTAYTFTVTATNAIGNSVASSASNSVTPVTVPGAPTGVTAAAGNAQATITFSAPVSDGGSVITGYTVTSSPGSFTSTSSTTAITVTGLTNGTAYTFTVKATNAIGNSVASSASNAVTPTTVPGAPTIGTATAGNAQATVTFSVPVSNGGSAITGYTVTSNPGNITGAGTATPITVKGLTNGTAYTFTVKATNAIGTSVASSASNSVTPTLTVPGAPTIGAATAGNAQATVTFTAPVSNGGAAITVYMVTSSPGGVTASGSTTAITVTGLTNGTAYTFTVTATNAIGTSVASAASNSVTPAPTVTDLDGNVYNTIAISTQVWMVENLKTTKYNDGTAIPNVTVDATWAALTTGAYSDYDNTLTNSNTYGRLYNWYAVDNNAATKVASNGGKNVCPTSWHVPTDAEWTTLTTYLGGEAVAGGKLKETGTIHWATPNTGATNETGFTALPGGYCFGNGACGNIGFGGYWWSSTEYSTTLAWHRYMTYDYTNVVRNYTGKRNGWSVRCVRDF